MKPLLNVLTVRTIMEQGIEGMQVIIKYINKVKK